MPPPNLSRPAGTTILITDRNLNVLGDPVAGWSNLEVTLRVNEPGNGSFTAPTSDTLTALVRGGGNRVVVIRDGSVFAAGPIEKPGPEKWSVDGGDSGSGTMTVHFADDLALVAGRVTYPNPAAASTAQTTSARWISVMNAEAIMRNLVNLNAGPGALAERKIPKLILGPLAGVGVTVKGGTRFDPLCDVLRSVALAGGGLAFRTQQVGTDIEFQVYRPVDRTAAVRFSPGLGNLRSYSYDPEAPSVTAAIVGGKDVGTSRLIVERTSSAAITKWWRLETFIDQRQSDDTSSDTTELNQAGDEAVGRGAETARLSAETVDTDDQRYGVHYQLGDIVTIVTKSGIEVADAVREVTLRSDPRNGEVVTSVIGPEDATTIPGWVQQVRALHRRIRNLETI